MPHKRRSACLGPGWGWRGGVPCGSRPSPCPALFQGFTNQRPRSRPACAHPPCAPPSGPRWRRRASLTARSSSGSTTTRAPSPRSRPTRRRRRCRASARRWCGAAAGPRRGAAGRGSAGRGQRRQALAADPPPRANPQHRHHPHLPARPPACRCPWARTTLLSWRRRCGAAWSRSARSARSARVRRAGRRGAGLGLALGPRTEGGASIKCLTCSSPRPHPRAHPSGARSRSLPALLPGIEEALKELKAKDNILPKLMASPSAGKRAARPALAREAPPTPSRPCRSFNSHRCHAHPPDTLPNPQSPPPLNNPPPPGYDALLRRSWQSTPSSPCPPNPHLTCRRPPPARPPTPGYDALFEKELAKYTKLKEDAVASVARNDGVLADLGRNAQVRGVVGEGELEGWGAPGCVRPDLCWALQAAAPDCSATLLRRSPLPSPPPPPGLPVCVPGQRVARRVRGRGRRHARGAQDLPRGAGPP
jgi:hypothetical protein